MVVGVRFMQKTKKHNARCSKNKKTQILFYEFSIIKPVTLIYSYFAKVEDDGVASQRERKKKHNK